MTAQTVAGRAMMDNQYGYDQVNNILSLKNNAEVPSSNLMGGSSQYSYEYDELYRLTQAEGKFTGSNHTHRYSLEMQYNSVGGITEKKQVHERKSNEEGSWKEQKKTSYELSYQYGDSQPHAPIHIGKQKYSYDANGNQTGWTHDVSGQRRQIVWDEENRIRAIADNGSAHHYIYDASGTRVLKGKSNGQSIRVNGEWKAGSGNMGNYTVYVNPYLVLRSGGYTKHYYIEGQRIVSKLGSGLNNKGKGPLKAGSEKVNYSKKQQDSREGIVKNLKWLGQDGQLLTAGNSGKTPPGQLKKIKGSDGGDGKDKGGKDRNAEKFQYYYHPDHLGSTSYITDASGEVYQHLEYFAFGETFVEEHSNRKHTPYKFNGKELDEETGLYYMKSRYYDPVTSIWLRVDSKASEAGLVGWSPYHFSFNNPILYTDPKGDCPPGVDCSNPLPQMRIRRNRASNLGPGNVRTNGTRFHAGHDLQSSTGTNISSTLAGEVVSSYNSPSYGNTVVVKSNIHPEAQESFIGPPRAGGAPEDNIYVQYSHLDARSVSVGDNVNAGQNVGTVGNTGNASNLSGEDIHLHIEVGTELNAAGSSIRNSSTLNTNIVYDNVSFTSADPTANQTNTSVIKTNINNGQQTRIYQPVNEGTSSDAILLNPVEVNGN